MYVQAGAGIVADSDPDFEQQECINKAKALFRAAEEGRGASPAPPNAATNHVKARLLDPPPGHRKPLLQR